MSQSFYGSVCLTDLIEHAKKQHSAFTKAENGKIYCNATVWLNDEIDKYGNIMALQLNPKKEFKERDGNPYIGNFKKSEAKAITQTDAKELDEAVSDLPF